MPTTLIVVLALSVVWLVAGVIAFRVITRGDAPEAALPTGGEVARRLIADGGLAPVTVHAGDVDAYIAADQEILLADGREARASLSAVAIAAHEAGHAAQHRDRARAWRLWWTLGPVAFIADLLLVPAVLLVALVGSAWMHVAVWLLLAVVVFAGLVSVAVERASVRWGLAQLQESGLVDDSQARAVRRVLRACAATYVAETVFDLGYLSRRLDRRDAEGRPRRSEPGDSDEPLWSSDGDG